MESADASSRSPRRSIHREPYNEVAHATAAATDRFEDNKEAVIDNPFLYWPVDEVEDKIRRFAIDHELEDAETVLIKAAKVLQDPEGWRTVPGLTRDEARALESEGSSGFWQQPKQLRIIIITLCIAAIVQGWNQTASNGANLDWPRQLGLKLEHSCSPTGSDAWIFAAVNASTYLAASLFGCWLSDPLNELLFGRRAAICASAALVLASIVGCAYAGTWQQLLGCRVLLGIGMGCKASVVPVFAAEVAPAAIRGSLVMNWQVFDALGIFLGFTANLMVSQVGASVWRWQTASSVLPTLILLTLIFVCPESPRFLMKHGQYEPAYRVLLALRGQAILAAKELLYTHFQREIEIAALSQKQAATETVESREKSATSGRFRSAPKSDFETQQSSQTRRSFNHWQNLGLSLTQTIRELFKYGQKFRQLFTVKRIQRATAAAVVCMVGQQLCGVNVLAFYSSSFFCEPGSQHDDPTHLKPLFLSWGIGLTNVLFALPAYKLIDKKGRRWLLLVTLPCLAVAMLATSLSSLMAVSNPARLPVVAFWTYVFMAFYSWGMGPVPFTMSAEVFPLENRVVGMSFAVFTNLFGAGILTLVVPALSNAIGDPILLGIFAILNVITFLLVFVFVRETSGAAVRGTLNSMMFLPLEELNYIFGVSTKDHSTYQLRTVLPWMWKYHVLRQRNLDPPAQLYTWAHAREPVAQPPAEGNVPT